LWVAGAALYFWMPISSMSNPPLNWGYPRTVEGFWHALTRGQYEKANPSNIISDPLRFVGQVWMYIQGCIEEFNLVYLLIALVPWLFFRRMQKREKAWMAGLFVIYLGLAALLLILLNPAPDRQSKELNRVFFTSSHVIIAMSVGYGLTLIGALLQQHYERIRAFALGGAAVAAGIALYAFADMKEQYLLAKVTAVVGIVLTLVAVAALAVQRQKAPLAVLLAVFATMPAYPILGHWWDNEQRGHLFGYWFGHDMFTPPFNGKDGKPLYPEMDRDTVLFGGTDPGRFNPTYMIYADSFVEPKHKQDTDPNFDRRDVYLITQNALADATYLMYIRAHYNRSAQIDPPFFSEFFKTRLFDPLDKIFLGLGDYVEKQRRAGTSYFEEDHFTAVAKFAGKLRPGDQQDALSRFLFDSLSPRTQKLVQDAGADKALARSLAKDLNVIIERELGDRDNPEFSASPRRLYETNRFVHISLSKRTQRFIKQNPQSHTRIRLNRLLLEEAYPDLITRSKGGVYPDLEILTPTVDDSQLAFQDYIADAQKRLQAGQLKPGEDVRVQDNRVQVSGQVAVMAINGLLTKVIFDKNPDHEFYVEESFPLDWMFPHLTPYGIIMKINRQPVPEMTEDILQRDHEFWAQYSTRFIGNWITYDTPVSNICTWAEQVYLRRDLRGFTGDPKFIRDDNAQKAFSKLRSAIGGLYSFRINTARTPAERARVIREADFAFKQSYAFCPFSPEAVFRYVNLLVSLGRPDDAILITRTCQKLDPDNSALQGLLDQLEGYKRGNQTEKLYREQPTNFQVAFNYAAELLKQKQTQQAVAVLDSVLNNPQADPGAVLSVAQAYLQVGAVTRLETAMKRLTGLLPDSPEGWYDLAAVQAILNKTNEAMGSLGNAMKYNAARKAKDPNAKDLLPNARSDQRFQALRNSPEFKKIVPP
jgi:tetratricopeptide (TPR) repeat protein